MLVTTGRLMLADNSTARLFKEAMDLTPNMFCFDMDEEQNNLPIMYPNRYQKLTILCPPPTIMYKAIDGDAEDFAESYDKYLESDGPKDIIMILLKFLSIGGQGIIYIPETDDLIWVNQLLIHLYANYGISIGTTKAPFLYDYRYDDANGLLLFKNGLMNVVEFLNVITLDSPYSPLNDRKVYETVCDMISYYTGNRNREEINKMIIDTVTAKFKGYTLRPAIRYYEPIGDNRNVDIRSLPCITKDKSEIGSV